MSEHLGAGTRATGESACEPEEEPVFHMGTVTVSPMFLGRMLLLPPGNRVVEVYRDTSDVTHGSVTLVIAGPDMPEVREGHLAPQVGLEYMKDPTTGVERLVQITKG